MQGMYDDSSLCVYHSAPAQAFQLSSKVCTSITSMHLNIMPWVEAADGTIYDDRTVFVRNIRHDCPKNLITAVFRTFGCTGTYS